MDVAERENMLVKILPSYNDLGALHKYASEFLGSLGY